MAMPSNHRSPDVVVVVGVVLIFGLGLSALLVLSASAQSLTAGVEVEVPSRQVAAFAEVVPTSVLAFTVGAGVQSAAATLSSDARLYPFGDGTLVPYLGLGGQVVFGSAGSPAFMSLLVGLRGHLPTIPNLQLYAEPALLVRLPDARDASVAFTFGLGYRF